MTKAITPTTYVPSGLVGPTAKAVLAELERRTALGEIHSAGGPKSLRLITRGPHAGQFGIPVLLIQSPRVNPWPKRRRVLGGVGAGLGVLLGLGWWAVATMGAAPFVIFLLAVLCTFGQRVYRRHARVEVTVTTTARVRLWK
jgi:hypothetical protein